MALKIIGAGFGRTGTLSLKTALEQLGFGRCYHMLEVGKHPAHAELWATAQQAQPVDWDALFDGYQSSVDWPSCNFWREQARHYPEAKILLSLRDPERWYESVMNTIYPSSSSLVNSTDPALQRFGRWSMEIIWQPLFENRMDDKSHVIEVFNRHNQSVIDEVPPDRLLVFEAKQGWAPLCEFLEVEIPATVYPRVNSTAEFQSRNTPRAS